MHQCLYIANVKYFLYILKRLWNKKQARKSLQRRPILITVSDYDYILEKFMHQYQIGYKRQIDEDDNPESHTRFTH